MFNLMNSRVWQDAWLANMDANLPRVRELFAATYGAGEVDKQIVNWRLFYLAVSELFAYNKGEEWFVSHYVFEK
jgi:cyclopropane-fatty-acyl-phospholipid synthase